MNAYHQRLRSWLSRFHGVASHYLPNYLGWRYLEQSLKLTGLTVIGTDCWTPSASSSGTSSSA